MCLYADKITFRDDVRIVYALVVDFLSNVYICMYSVYCSEWVMERVGKVIAIFKSTRCVSRYCVRG